MMTLIRIPTINLFCFFHRFTPAILYTLFLFLDQVIGNLSCNSWDDSLLPIKPTRMVTVVKFLDLYVISNLTFSSFINVLIVP